MTLPSPRPPLDKKTKVNRQKEKGKGKKTKANGQTKQNAQGEGGGRPLGGAWKLLSLPVAAHVSAIFIWYVT